MRYEHASIPLGVAWSSPFARWQGPLADVDSLNLAAAVTRRALADRGIAPDQFSQLVLGWTVPQHPLFFGAPTLAARIGAPGLTGPMVSQACATSVACLALAAQAADVAPSAASLVVATDRTSNGPLLAYPAPGATGGAPAVENWVLDNMAYDPTTAAGMLHTAETVAAEAGIGREELDDLTLLRYEQYGKALEQERAFQRRYMVPVEIPRRRGEPLCVDADTGIFPTTREGLARLQPVQSDGVVTFGTQTHPADGCAGAVVTGDERARELSPDGAVVRILASGFARVAPAHMPQAPVPAAVSALDAAGLTWADLDAVTTHNPFAVNDAWFSRCSGIPPERVNVYGSSLVFGHPQGPTGARLVAELIETLRLRGGGVGLFTGCAAGDSAGAVVVRVDD